MGDKKILIIDDEKNTLHLLKVIFEKQGYNVVTIEDGIDINKKIDVVKPDLIILDILMPKINGLELLKQINQHNTNSTIPVIVLTSYHNIDTKLDALKIGALDYLTKPFQKEELLYRVRNIFEHYSKNISERKIDNSLIAKLFQNEDQILSPQVDKNSQYGYTYPQAVSVLTPVHNGDVIDQLDEFVNYGYLEKIFFDIIPLCPHCKHYNIIFREVCPYCINIIETSDNTTNFECQKCNRHFSQPAINYKCMNCSEVFPQSGLIKKKIYKYKLSTSDRNPQKAHNIINILIKAFKETKINYVEYNQFKKKIAHAIFLASDEGYNVTVMSVEIKKLSAIQSKFGLQLSLRLLKNVLLVIKKNLRQFDVISYNNNKILLLLPKIHLNMAKIFAERVQSYFERINQEVALEIKLASYPEDGYNETEILAMLELGIETIEEKFIP